MQHHIFLSYSRKDIELMHRIRDSLKEEGLSVWTDEGIKPGAVIWEREIENAITNAGCMIVILTPNIKDAKGLRDEISYANIHRVQIFPLLAAGEPKESVPYTLSSTQWVDIRTNYASRINQIILSICGYLNMESLSSKSPRKSLPGLEAPENPPNIQQPEPPNVQLAIHGDLIVKRISASSKSVSSNPPFDLEKFTTRVLEVLPPPFDWCYISGGKTTLKTGHSYTVSDFLIGRYAITNAQYQEFVRAKDGWLNKHWYDYYDAARFYRDKVKKHQFTAFPGDNLPRTNVSWYDAVAFCHWLNKRIGLAVSLPTEQQWERAAVGDNGWTYPWGNDFDSSYCCFKGVQPVNVTEYQAGASPFDVLNMSGNVYEWCLNDYDDPDTHDPTRDIHQHVLRGGSWSNTDIKNLRADYRHHALTYRATNNNVGFRIVLSPNA